MSDVTITRDLLTGLATDMDAEGLAQYTGGPGGTVFFKQLPTSPDRAVALTVYATQDEPDENVTVFRAQFMFRGAPNRGTDVDDFADDVFMWFQGLRDRTYGSVELRFARRVSSVQLGVDESKRSERADNYALTCNTPSTSGRPE